MQNDVKTRVPDISPSTIPSHDCSRHSRRCAAGHWAPQGGAGGARQHQQWMGTAWPEKLKAKQELAVPKEEEENFSSHIAHYNLIPSDFSRLNFCLNHSEQEPLYCGEVSNYSTRKPPVQSFIVVRAHTLSYNQVAFNFLHVAQGLRCLIVKSKCEVSNHPQNWR